MMVRDWRDLRRPVVSFRDHGSEIERKPKSFLAGRRSGKGVRKEGFFRGAIFRIGSEGREKGEMEISG